MTSLEIILIFGGLVACIYLAYIEGLYDGEEKANKKRKAKRTVKFIDIDEVRGAE